MYIESKSNERIKSIVKLRDKANREENGLFFFEGAHLLEEYLRHGHAPYALYVCEKSAEEYSELIGAVDRNIIYTVSEDVFSKISTEKAPQGILTVSAFLENNAMFMKEKADYKIMANTDDAFLFLDSLRDNGNVGTIIRTAAALGGVYCVLSSDCADIYSNKTIRATMGALFSSKTYIASDISEAVSTVQKSGRRVFASALGNTTLTLGKFEIENGDCFVVGNEGQGIREEIIKLCDSAVKIPMTNAAESLNASAAAAILLWNMRKG